ncbi:MAG TPA: transglycosylase domain-containing protein, partial [Limnochordia bacterium]|nr:transglycosylase domain-containing protein [Limnochordia bacterium]
MKRRNLYLILALLVLLIGAGVVTSLYVQAGRHITSFEDARPLPGAVLYDQEGEVIKRLGTGGAYRPLDETPRELQNAVKSTESVSSIKSRLARQILKPQGLWARLQQALLPSVLARRYSEREQLEIYLNNAYFGEGAYGVEAASQTYFATSVGDIDLAQSALLAALAQDPEDASPFSHPDRAQEQRNTVLVQMERDGHINKAQEDEAKVAAIEPKRREPGYAHHFSDYLGNLLVGELGEERVFQGGLRVTTTLDRDLQKLAESMFQEAQLDGALVALNPSDGAILAMVGGLDYLENSTNLATVKHQEVGTSLRPLIYATALQEEWAVNHLVEDVQRKFGDLEADNTDDRYWGPVTMKHALVMDLSNAAIWTLNELGLERFNSFAQSVGLSIEKVDQDLRLAIGEIREGLSLLDLTSAYLPGVSEGHYIPASAFQQVTDTENQSILANQQGTPKLILSPEQAYLLTDMLMPSTTYGSIRELDVPFSAALQSSAAQDGSSQWAIGYTPSLLVGVYVQAPEESLDEEVDQSQLLAGDLWVQFMTSSMAEAREDEGEGNSEATDTNEDEDETEDGDSGEFEVPENVETNVLIDVFTGLLASERCPQVERDAFI